MILQIPIDPLSVDQELSVSLDDKDISLRIRWNERAESWFASLFDDKGDPILQSKRVSVGIPLFARTLDDRLPNGVFMAFDTELALRDPGFQELGDRVKLIYVTEDSVLAVFGGDSFGGISLQ